MKGRMRRPARFPTATSRQIGGDIMRLRALLETEALGLRLLGGEEELDRTVHGVMTTDLRDPSRYLSGGELVLSGLAWRRDAADSEPFVRRLVQAGGGGPGGGGGGAGNRPGGPGGGLRRGRGPPFRGGAA